VLIFGHIFSFCGTSGILGQQKTRRANKFQKEYALPPPSNDDAWAVSELAAAELGDARRPQRLIALATILAQRPGASLPAACGDDALLKAAYRFFDNAAIEPQDLLDSPVGATVPRLAPVPLVLAVQDTTELAWSAPPAPTGLGPLGHPAHRWKSGIALSTAAVALKPGSWQPPSDCNAVCRFTV
jgi:hypothetical protein